jgi:hypothetical protein
MLRRPERFRDKDSSGGGRKQLDRSTAGLARGSAQAQTRNALFLGSVPAERCGGGEREPGDETCLHGPSPVFRMGASAAFRGKAQQPSKDRRCAKCRQKHWNPGKANKLVPPNGAPPQSWAAALRRFARSGSVG